MSMAISEDNNAHPESTEPNGPTLLRKALASKGWTQLRAAQELGVSTTTVSRWLSGERCPDREHMSMLREIFGIPPEVWVPWNGARRAIVESLSSRS